MLALNTDIIGKRHY